MEGLIFYQSTYPEFRYEDEKVLRIQPHPTRASASTHCVPNLNLIKGRFIIYPKSHTLYHTSKEYNMA